MGSVVAQLSAKFKKPLQLVDVMKHMMTNSQMVANKMNEEFSSVRGPQTYCRFDVEQGLSSLVTQVLWPFYNRITCIAGILYKVEGLTCVNVTLSVNCKEAM